MRSAPENVTPIVSNGIRYEAPHFGVSPGRGGTSVTVMSSALEAALRKDVEAGRESNPQDPDWIRAALTDCPVSVADKQSFVDAMTFQLAVAPVLQKVMGEMMRKAFAGGGMPSMGGDDLRNALEADGTLSPEQIDRLVDQASGREPVVVEEPAQNGGLLVAYDDATNQEIWQLRVYTTDLESQLEQEAQDLFITGLELEGDVLLVRDELARTHRVDLHARRVV